ncbi:flavin monoamine oxidase family protein [Caulobacter soli]|uniref:flavin monoamine oxidase family protein n=1 Tax=Caulobacter soli TaxID=2708539 RepID=UPI00196B1660|nr:NAD(P)/FAD-dependent oxidoreductase [Caulobacter soli]
MADLLDVAVIGGGAAGIAAARRLTAKGRSVLVVEALPRLGGRARTIAFDGLPLDLGCHWLHSAARNPLAREAEAQGLVLQHGRGAWRHRLPEPLNALQDQGDGWAAYAALADRLRRAPPASDRASDALAGRDRWRPFVDAISSFANGVELDRLSVADFLAYENAGGASNWRLSMGYGAFIAELGAPLPRAFSTRVLSVSQGDEISLETDRGPIRARAAIVTASSAMLAAGAIRFTPSIDEHLQAATRLPLGLANKVFLSLDATHRLPAEAHLMGDLHRAATGSYYLRPLGRPLIEGFLGGANAKALEAEGKPAAIAFVKDELAGLFGSTFVQGLTPIIATAWGQEPTIGGSYSHALPGHASARAVLARPISEQLCLAGEACSLTDFSTAHGAWESGLAAADVIDQGLGARSRRASPVAGGRS